MTDASQPKQAVEALNFEFVDLPQPAETFADSVQSLFFDGQNLRIVFCASRLEEQKGGGRPFRGTDNPSLSGDIWNGWRVGAGKGGEAVRSRRGSLGW